MRLDTKTYWLTERQSQCDFDFDCKFSVSESFKRIETKTRGEYKKSACEDAKCELKALFEACDSIRLNTWKLLQIDWKDWRVMIVNV
jgi:hypothetical protein